MKTKMTNLLTKSWYKLIFYIMGLASLIWFLVRVIPKPSRANYPCMKAAAPVASTFVAYLLGITGMTFFFKKARQKFFEYRFLLTGLFIIAGMISGTIA